jgi:hypothetical protein
LVKCCLVALQIVGSSHETQFSWFSKLKQILAIYELPSSHNILDLPPTKNAWKKMVNKAVDEYWIEHIKKMSTYFKSLDY